MNRREFMTGTAAFGMVSAGLAAHAEEEGGQKVDQQYFELRTYRILPGEPGQRFHKYLREAGIPALNRAGVEPVGVMQAKYGDGSLMVYVLLTHGSMESVATLADRLMQDEQHGEAGADFLDRPLAESGFVRFESSLMRAFKGMPTLEAPATDQERIFELRRYESHSLKAAKKKIEMFDEGGEIAIFRKTGLTPVFFGESIIGPNLPNLTYMLTFKDMAERDKNWETFINHPEWKELSQDPQYAGTVSNIEDTILRPLDYSQV